MSKQRTDKKLIKYNSITVGSDLKNCIYRINQNLQNVEHYLKCTKVKH